MTELTDRERWLQALESGDYEQCRGYMRQDVKGDRSYCCLGVACEIFGYNLVPQEGYAYGVPIDDVNDNASGACEDVQSQYLPDMINVRLGMTCFDNETLVSLNDDHTMNFAQIAQFVRDADADNEHLNDRYARLFT